MSLTGERSVIHVLKRICTHSPSYIIPIPLKAMTEYLISNESEVFELI